MIEVEAKERMLVTLASRFVGVHEVGENRGPLIDVWQRRQFQTSGWPWCLIFIQELVDSVDLLYDAAHLMCSTFRHGLPETAHVMTLWRALEAYRLDSPRPGALAVWRLKGSDSGHIGIVEHGRSVEMFGTIEGNTGDGNEREGEGIARKTCTARPRGNLELKGFVPAWR